MIPVYLEAEDWQYYGSEEKRDKNFELAPLRLCGFLVSRNKKNTVVTMQWYKAYDEVRHTTVIPNHSITKLIYLKGAKNESRAKSRTKAKHRRRNKKLHNK